VSGREPPNSLNLRSQDAGAGVAKPGLRCSTGCPSTFQTPSGLLRLLRLLSALVGVDAHFSRRLFPESLRIKGGLLLLQAATGAAVAAEDHFRQALDWARRQGALSLELSAATSLARLLRDRGRSADATALLQPAYDRFTEGFASGDLKAAKALLDAIRLRLAATTPDELTALARRMNATPRKCLQFKTPAEVLQAFVTASATPTIVEGTVSRFG
jgi:hypothetical protein